jgi:hypothetical protein
MCSRGYGCACTVYTRLCTSNAYSLTGSQHSLCLESSDQRVFLRMKQVFVLPAQKAFKWQPKKSELLAVASKDVSIYNKSGNVLYTVPGDFHCFEWSPDGAYLAIIFKNSPDVILLNSRGEVSRVDSGMKHLDCIFWSHTFVLYSDQACRRNSQGKPLYL